MTQRIVCGDIMRFAAHYRGERFHGVLCDPPYELGFMGKSWDSRGVSFRAETWSAIKSLLVPGAYLMAFGGTRTFHRIAVAIEDAGFEIRDTLGWLYGSGFPKSHNLHGEWEGYGTALKPAWEPVILARVPLSGTVAANALEHGAGALNVDGGRVEGGMWKPHTATGLASKKFFTSGNAQVIKKFPHASGRWPAHIIHDGGDDAADVLGDAQRFFYCAKASKSERNHGVENNHPTVKPLALIEYLAKLILPPAHIESRMLVPFAGSGSECIGAARAGWKHVVGVERERQYVDIARARIAAWRNV